jgi:hypothetical protein
MSEINQNLLTAYSFLAALTENQNDLYNSVYVPICKRALSIYSAKRQSHGSIDNIQNIILEEFQIKIPSAFLKRLLRSVSQQMSTKEKNVSSFVLFENGQHFSIGRYAFIDLEIKVKRGKREATAIQKAFEEFLEEEQVSPVEILPFAEFLKKNNSRLASFFSGKSEVDGSSLEESYYHHVRFLQFIESSNQQLYAIVESMYLGSIVVSFLEADFDFESKFTTGESYYLDTPFILRVLDLQKEEDCKAAQELIDLIKTTGGKLRVLSITVDELDGILEKAIYLYNSKSPTSTINEACQRKGINKTYLIQLAGSLEDTLSNKLGLTIETVTNQQKEKYVKTNDLKLLREKRTRAGTAEHDVIAYLYVRDIRKGVVHSFQKAKAWFLTTNVGLLSFNRSNMPFQGISEIVLPDALTSLLWLRNPAQLSSKVKNAGLGELMSVTISEEIASKELISEFEATIASIQGISDVEYKTLLNSVAYESAKRIERFIDKSVREPEQAAIEAQKLIEKERRRRNNEQKRLKEATLIIKKEQEVKDELAVKIAKIESDLVAFSSANLSLRYSRDEDRTTIEKLQQEIVTYKKFSKKWIKSLIIFIGIVLISFLAWKYWSNVIAGLDWLWKGILAIGAAWSFGSFIVNLIKAIKSK